LSSRCIPPLRLLSKHCWFRPVCASSPAIVSVRSWSSTGWVVPQSSAPEVGCWNGGDRVGRKYSSSSRSLTPARRPGRVGSQRDPSDGQVSSVARFSIPLPRRGAGAYIVGVVDHPYLAALTAYHAVVHLHHVRRPYGEACVHR
ncbi:hypothetical protein GW17_00060254, partial [Ensete ventricosum]